MFSGLDEVLEFINNNRKKERTEVKKEVSNKTKKNKVVRRAREQKSERTYLWEKKQSEILSLYDRGYSVWQISKMLKISVNTVIRSLSYAGVEIESRGKKRRVLRSTLELLCEYIMNPSKEFARKYGKPYTTRIQEFFKHSAFPRPRFLSESERREVVKIIKEFLSSTNKEIFTIDELEPLLDKVKPYRRVWKGRVKELAPEIWRLYSSGYKVREIARRLNISERSVRDVVYKKKYLPS